MPASAELLSIYSPPLETFAALPADITDALDEMAEDMAMSPDSYKEPGRSSRRFVYGGEEWPALQKVVNQIAEITLHRPLENGAVGFHNVITDQEAFDEHTRSFKAAAAWHQETINTHAITAPIPGERILWMTHTGTDIAEGDLVFEGKITKLDTVKIDRKTALESGELVVGNDNLLVKAAMDPIEGRIYQAPVRRPVLLPAATVHRSPLEMPNGRQFLQVDAWKQGE